MHFLKTRTRVVLWVSGITYIITVTWFLFPTYFTTVLDIPALIIQVTGICSIVIVFTFLSIETRTRKSKRTEMVLGMTLFWRIIVVPSLRQVLTKNTPAVVEVFPLLALVLLHIGMLLLLRLKRKNFQKRAEYTSFSLFSVGVGAYSLAVSLGLASLVAVHVYEKERNCTTFYHDLDSISEKVDGFLFEWKNTVQRAASWVMDFGSRSVGDALGVSQDQWDTLVMEYVQHKENVSTAATWLSLTWWMLWALHRFQTKVIGGILQDRNAINQWVCTLIFEQIQRNIRQGIGSYSILLGLFFLLSPLLALFLRIIGIVGRLLLKFALRKGRYTWGEHTKVIKEIE